jgi:hypothetical protein
MPSFLCCFDCCECFTNVTSSLVKLSHGPVRTWAALRASSVASRFEALHATGLTALIGREEDPRRHQAE